MVFLGAACGSTGAAEGIQPLHPGAIAGPSTGSSSGDRAPARARSPSPGSQAAQGPARAPSGEDPEVIGAWRTAERAFENAALSADTSEPELIATTVEPQLGTSESLLNGMREADEFARGPVDLGFPTVVASTSTEATIRSCLIDGEIVISRRTGLPVAGVEGRVANELVISVMERPDGEWVLADQSVREIACKQQR